LDNLGDKIRKAVTSWKNIIKWTKRFVGLLITGALLWVTYYVVNLIGRGVLWCIDNWNGENVLFRLTIVGIIAAFIGVFFALRAWALYMGKHGTKLWYVKAIYLFFYWVVFMPLKIILYHFLWQLILTNLWWLIEKGAKIIWGTLLGFLGIFGEYFGASYTDYCPGVIWEEEKSE